MIFGGGIFGRWLGHQDRVFKSEKSAFNQEDPSEFLVLSAMWWHSEKIAIYEPESNSYQKLNLLAPG